MKQILRHIIQITLFPELEHANWTSFMSKGAPYCLLYYRYFKSQCQYEFYCRYTDNLQCKILFLMRWYSCLFHKTCSMFRSKKTYLPPERRAGLLLTFGLEWGNLLLNDMKRCAVKSSGSSASRKVFMNSLKPSKSMVWKTSLNLWCQTQWDSKTMFKSWATEMTWAVYYLSIVIRVLVVLRYRWQWQLCVSPLIV